MNETERFSYTLQRLKPTDWDKLFSLIPEIESVKNIEETEKGKEMETTKTSVDNDWARVDSKLTHVLYDLNLVIPFDWMSWAEAGVILKNQDFDYSTLDKITLCKLLTGIVRADRFSYGTTIHFLKNGIMTKIIKALKQKYTEVEQSLSYKIKSALFGVAVGDAVGVPYEFSPRQKMEANPATDMVGYGTYNLPPGTWSDDSSLTFCLAEALANDGYKLSSVAANFYLWKAKAYWSANGSVFDIGITTSIAISRLEAILKSSTDAHELKQLKNESFENENGNGSLMRILPLLFHIAGMPIKDQFQIVWDVSALTHRPIRAAMSCMIYLKLAEKIVEGKDKITSYAEMRNDIFELWKLIDFPDDERNHFIRIIQNDIQETNISDLRSGGYVIEVLESGIYFFLTMNTYRDAVLSIINIGHDTDTSAAIAGGLAGLYYGYDNIPENWKMQLARKEDIVNLSERLAEKLPASYTGN